MPASEIDDIFAGVASTSSASVAKAPTKKQKKRKAEVVESGSSSSKSNSTPSSSLVTGKSKSDKPKKTQSGKAAAETVLDPSKIIEAKVQAKKLKPSSSKSKLTEEEADFMDTRGKSSECLYRFSLDKAVLTSAYRTEDRRRISHL